MAGISIMIFTSMKTTIIGRQAEAVAAEYLKKLGYKTMVKNWRTRWCEIDIVAVKDKVVYFAEVKYRFKDNWGDGLEVITNKKLQQMTFAADLWVQENNWQEDYRLAVIGVTGQPPAVTDFVEV
jgi:uncharacterized protein (TIGR00252 family)